MSIYYGTTKVAGSSFGKKTSLDDLSAQLSVHDYNINTKIDTLSQDIEIKLNEIKRLNSVAPCLDHSAAFEFLIGYGQMLSVTEMPYDATVFMSVNDGIALSVDGKPVPRYVFEDSSSNSVKLTVAAGMKLTVTASQPDLVFNGRVVPFRYGMKLMDMSSQEKVSSSWSDIAHGNAELNDWIEYVSAERLKQSGGEWSSDWTAAGDWDSEWWEYVEIPSLGLAHMFASCMEVTIRAKRDFIFWYTSTQNPLAGATGSNQYSLPNVKYGVGSTSSVEPTVNMLTNQAIALAKDQYLKIRTTCPPSTTVVTGKNKGCYYVYYDTGSQFYTTAYAASLPFSLVDIGQ